MLNFGKMARLVLFTTLPALAMAQSAQVSSMPQSAPPQAIQASPAVAANTASSPNDSAQDATATVEYVKGQLTVISHGAPLGSILKLVSTKTGALVALAPELQNEPVVGQLGPGTVREVVTSLLDSPRIGYILMGAGNDPDRLQKIVVQSRRPAAHGAVAEYRPPPQEDEENKIDENGKLPSGSHRKSPRCHKMRSGPTGRGSAIKSFRRNCCNKNKTVKENSWRSLSRNLHLKISNRSRPIFRSNSSG